MLAGLNGEVTELLLVIRGVAPSEGADGREGMVGCIQGQNTRRER